MSATEQRSAVPRFSGALGRPAGPLLVALVAGTLFVLVRLATYDWNPTGFVHAGGTFVDRERAPANLIIREGEVGFDGTGYYRLALDPFTDSADEHGIVLDLPPFRQQRILYPLVVWAASGGGRPALVPWFLIAANLAAFAAIGWLGGALAREFGRSPWWGITVAAYPGFAISLGLDTAEIVAGMFLLAGIYAMMRQRPGWATAAFTAAMFTRETTLLIVLGAAAAWVARRRKGTPGIAAYTFVVPLGAYVAWQAFLWDRWGALALRQGGGIDITFPFAGLVQQAPDWPQTDGAQAAFHYLLLIAMGGFLYIVARDLRRSNAPDFVLFAAVPALVLPLLFSDDIWLHHWGFLRAFTETYLLGALVLLASERERLDRVAVLSGGFWAAIGINLVAHR